MANLCSKDILQTSKKNIEETANRNAAKVDRANGKGNLVVLSAQRDRNRIEQQAEDHAARTEKAVDDSMNTVKGTIENIKDALSQ